MASGAMYGGMGFASTHAMVTGARAAMGAAAYISHNGKYAVSTEEIARAKQEVCRPMADVGGFSPAWEKAAWDRVFASVDSGIRFWAWRLWASPRSDQPFAKRIAIANRTPGKAGKLAEEFGRFFPDTVIYPVDSGDAGAMTKELGLTDLLVNSTSGGMEGASGLEINIGALRDGAAVYDLVYKPRETKLVKEAKALGHKAVGGLGMLLYQGALSFEIWTGENAPVDVMRKAIS